MENNFYGEIEDYLDKFKSPSGNNSPVSSSTSPARKDNLEPNKSVATKVALVERLKRNHLGNMAASAEKRKLMDDNSGHHLDLLTPAAKSVKLDNTPVDDGQDARAPNRHSSGGILAQALLEKRPSPPNNSTLDPVSGNMIPRMSPNGLSPPPENNVPPPPPPPPPLPNNSRILSNYTQDEDIVALRRLNDIAKSSTLLPDQKNEEVGHLIRENPNVARLLLKLRNDKALKKKAMENPNRQSTVTNNADNKSINTLLNNVDIMNNEHSLLKDMKNDHDFNSYMSNPDSINHNNPDPYISPPYKRGGNVNRPMMAGNTAGMNSRTYPPPPNNYGPPPPMGNNPMNDMWNSGYDNRPPPPMNRPIYNNMDYHNRMMRGPTMMGGPPPPPPPQHHNIYHPNDFRNYSNVSIGPNGMMNNPYGPISSNRYGPNAPTGPLRGGFNGYMDVRPVMNNPRTNYPPPDNYGMYNNDNRLMNDGYMRMNTGRGGYGLSQQPMGSPRMSRYPDNGCQGQSRLEQAYFLIPLNSRQPPMNDIPQTPMTNDFFPDNTPTATDTTNNNNNTDPQIPILTDLDALSNTTTTTEEKSWKLDCSELRKKLLLNLQNTLISQGNPDAYGIAEKVELEAFNSSDSEDTYTMRLAEWLAGIFHQQSDSPKSPTWYSSNAAEPLLEQPLNNQSSSYSDSPSMSDANPILSSLLPSSSKTADYPDFLSSVTSPPADHESSDGEFTSPAVGLKNGRRSSGKSVNNPHSVDSGIGSPRSIPSTSIYSPKIPQGASPNVHFTPDLSPDKL